MTKYNDWEDYAPSGKRRLIMASRNAVKLLLALVLGLPIVLAVLGWVVGLLTAMEDAAAGTVLRHLSTGVSVLWLMTVVGLVIALAVETLDEPDEP